MKPRLELAARVIDLYDRNAANWDRERSRSLFERPWLDRFVALLPEQANICDLGCGNGEPIAAHLIAAGFRVTGIDSSPAMIAICQQRFPGAHWHAADMRSPGLDRIFDGILAWDSFFHLPQHDQHAMFPIFRALAAENAALMFTSGPEVGEAIGSFHGEALFHASLAPETYRALLAQNGFAVVAHVAEDAACGGRTVWLARHQDG